MNKMKTLSGFWIFIMFALFASLGVYAMYYRNNYEFLELEKQIEEVVRNDKNLTNEIGSSNYYRIESQRLSGLVKLSANGEKCSGYVEYRKILSIKIYKSFILCGDYKSIGYK